jgi:hypothetical protein
MPISLSPLNCSSEDIVKSREPPVITALAMNRIALHFSSVFLRSARHSRNAVRFDNESGAPIRVLTVQVEQVCKIKLGVLAEQLTRRLHVLRRSAVLLQTGESWQRQ